MKYQLLISIYLIIIAYCTDDPCNEHYSSEACEEDTSNSYAWTWNNDRTDPVCEPLNNECPVTGYANSQSECQAYGEYCKFTGTEFHCMNPYTCVERTGRSDCSGGPYYWENASCHINETLCEVNIERDCWDKRFCSYQAKNGTCVESCSAVKTKTE